MMNCNRSRDQGTLQANETGSEKEQVERVYGYQRRQREREVQRVNGYERRKRSRGVEKVYGFERRQRERSASGPSKERGR